MGAGFFDRLDGLLITLAAAQLAKNPRAIAQLEELGVPAGKLAKALAGDVDGVVRVGVIDDVVSVEKALESAPSTSNPPRRRRRRPAREISAKKKNAKTTGDVAGVVLETRETIEPLELEDVDAGGRGRAGT